MAARHCCKQMSSAVGELIAYEGRAYTYGLVGKSSRAEPTSIRFCPWCGSLLFRARAKPADAPASRKPARRVAKKKKR
jgi:hypothetical protein